MIRSKLTILTLLTFMTVLMSCYSSTSSNNNENKPPIDDATEQIDQPKIDSIIQVGSKASEFVKHLKNGEKLSSFFNDRWLFVYHEDNRCDGSTDGKLEKLNKSMIDSIIRLQVKNDGDAWACDKKAPKTYDLDFDLKKKITGWDRFEIPNYENQDENLVYVLGAGESDYLILHYDDNKLIVKLEYRSEDPG